ncbi:putative ribonuclease H-like domain-containing protein [Tanacetum coccineum]
MMSNLMKLDPFKVFPKKVMEKLLDCVDLSEEEAETSLEMLLGEGSQALISAFLVLLRAKGETFEEIVGLSRAMIKCCRKVEGIENAVDIVGTGGDGANTVNISTGAAILAAACGVKVAKNLIKTFGDSQQGNSPKSWKKVAKGKYNVHPPVSLDEHVAVQRENKVRTLLLQALPEDHMPDFHHYDDARDIWMAVKARFGGNEESKKMKKTMLKQQFAEFSVTEEEGLHKGYDRFQKILSQLNQVQARPDNDDINLKFSKSPSFSCQNWSIYGVKVAQLADSHTHSAFHHGYFIVLECVSASFLADKEQDQDMIYEDFDQVDQLEMEEMDLKWQMAMLSLRINRSLRQTNQKLGLRYLCELSDHAAENKTTVAVEKVQKVVPLGIKKKRKKGEVKFEATLARFEKWKESSKNLKNLIDSSMSTRTKVGLGFQEYFGVDEVFDLSTPSVFYSDPVEKEVKPLYSTFVKAGEMHAVPPSITGTYMPSPYQSDIEETQVSNGSKSDNNISDTISESNDFVSCDNSDKSSDSETHASCDSSLKTQTKDIPPAVDIQTLPESDVEDPNSTTGSPSFSCSENVKSPRIICNKSGVNNRKVCKNNFVRVKKCFVCGSKLHLIKDCDFYNCVDSVPCKSKAASIPAGSRNSSASVPADRSDPAASRNRPAVNPADRPHPAGWSKRPATVSAGRPVSAGWLNPAARPLFRPSSVTLGGITDHNFGGPRVMVDLVNPQGDPSTDNDIGIVDSGLTLKSLTGTRKKLDDFVSEQGRLVNLEVEIEFQLPEAVSGTNNFLVKHDLYTFHISDLQPEQKVTCFVAKASLDESTRWHRRMAHVNFKTINKLAKEGLVDGLPLKSTKAKLIELCGQKGIKRDYSNPRTPQQNGVAERKNRTLIEAARTMLADSKLPTMFWTEAVSTASEIQNHGISADMDPAGIASAGSDPAGGNPAGSSQPAGSNEPAGTGNPAVSTSVSADFILVHADESTLPPGQPLGSSEHTTRFPVPSDVCMDQLSSGIFTSSSYDDDFSATLTNLAPVVDVNQVPTRRVNTIHPQSQILGDLASPVLTRSRAQKSKFGESAFIGYIQDQQRTNHTDQLHCLFGCFLSQLEPTSIAKALEDPDWVAAMQEEMQQFINQQVWKLVPLPDGKHAIGTKWILKNKRDARGIVVRNKARLVAQGHRQEEGIDYDEVFAPVARIEAIRLFLAFASYMGFLVYQLDVKSAFLYGEIEEEVYVTQPKGFEDPYFPKHVYRVVKALYGLHQAPRAWYARLSAFLLQHNYRRGTIDKTLFIKKDSRDIILVQVYVDDIIFGSTNKAWCDEFEVLMKGEFEMSAMGEMTFFLGLQVKQLPDGLFISQDKYVKDMLTKFDMESVRTATTPYEAAKTKLKDETDPPVNVHLYRSMIGSLMYLTASRPDIMFAVSACSRHQVTPLTSHLNAVKKIFKYLKGQPKLGLWYPKDSPFQLEAYSDSDYAGSHGDRKSTTGGCQFLGRRLISWQCKKQTIVATSSTEAEYVAAASCCAQVLWIQNQMLDYGFNFMNTKIFIDNQSTICIVKNPVFHQRTKHIEIRHHFIRDANEKNLIQVLKIHTDDNVADLLTKAFDGPRFAYLVVHIGMVDNTAARCTFFLLTGLVSAGSTMILLVVIFPAGCLVYVPAVCMVSAVGGLFLLTEYIHAAGVVYAANTSIYAAELVCAGSIKFLLADLFLLVVTCFCCLNLVSAVLSLILLVGWSLPLVTWFLLVVSIPAGGTMYLLPE